MRRQKGEGKEEEEIRLWQSLHLLLTAPVMRLLLLLLLLLLMPRIRSPKTPPPRSWAFAEFVKGRLPSSCCCDFFSC